MTDTMLRLVASEGYAIAACDMSNTARLIAEEQHHLSGEPFNIIASALLGSALLGTRLKGRGLLTLEFSGDGIIDYFRVDSMGLGSLRALVPTSVSEACGGWNGVDSLLGEGKLAITKQIEHRNGQPGQPYRSAMLANAADMNALLNDVCIVSEQVSARILIDVSHDRCRGLLIERLPGCEDEAIWQRVLTYVDAPDIWRSETADYSLAEIAQHTIGHDETQSPLKNLHEYEVKFYCPCARERYLNTLVGFPDQQLISLVDNDGQIHCTCDFCHATYEIPLDEVLGNKSSGDEA